MRAGLAVTAGVPGIATAAGGPLAARVGIATGLAIVGDPTDGNRQSDLLAYGLSIAQAIHQGVEVVGEVKKFVQNVHH